MAGDPRPPLHAIEWVVLSGTFSGTPPAGINVNGIPATIENTTWRVRLEVPTEGVIANLNVVNGAGCVTTHVIEVKPE